MMSSRAEQGLHDLATDIRDALRRHDTKEIKTTESKSGGVTNIINNYGTRTPTTRYGFARDVWLVFWMVFTITGVYLILSHPEWIVSFGNWLRTVF